MASARNVFAAIHSKALVEKMSTSEHLSFFSFKVCKDGICFTVQLAFCVNFHCDPPGDDNTCRCKQPSVDGIISFKILGAFVKGRVRDDKELVKGELSE